MRLEGELSKTLICVDAGINDDQLPKSKPSTKKEAMLSEAEGFSM
jgi:hypothetical protein